MIRILFVSGLAAALVLAPCAPGLAEEGPTGRSIMEKVDARDDGDRSTLSMEMTLIDRRGGQRVRRLRSFGRDVGQDEQSAMFFVSPADVERTAFLTYDYDDEAVDDDQWLYLPALARTKRIAAADKSGSFMGSDFSYADMSDRPLDAYAYTLMKEAEVDGHLTWQVAAVPVTEKEQDETGVEKSILFVRQDNFVVVRGVYWMKKGKRLKYFDVKALEQIDGIWVATELHMTTKKGERTVHKTILRMSDVKFNQDLDAEFFTIRRIEKGL